MFGRIFKKNQSSKDSRNEDKTTDERNVAGRGPVDQKPPPERKQMVEHKPPAGPPPQPSSSLVPIFSWRSILVILLGLVIGLGVGIGYWAFSPSAVVSDTTGTETYGGGFLESMGIGPAPPTEPWKSEVKVQVVNTSSSFSTMAQLASLGTYYAAKAKSLPFLQFLSTDLATNSPMYQHTVDELNTIITGSYDSTSEQPTIILQVTTPTAEEAIFLASRIPEVFKNFLIAEENQKQEQTRQTILVAIEDIKDAIIQAEQEVNILEGQGVSGIENDPDYIALDTRVKALETELLRQANILATMTYEGNSEQAIAQEYQKTLDEIKLVKTGILVAQQKVNKLAEQKAATDFVNQPEYITLTAEIAALEAQINIIMNGGTDIVTGLRTLGLAEMIADGVTSGAAYEDAKTKLDTASKALSEDKKQLAILVSQTSDEQLQVSLDIQLAQADLDSLNAKLTVLMQKLSDLASEDVATNTQENFEKTSAALAKARQQLAALQVNLVGSQLSQDLDYQNAQARVVTLNNELATLNNSLSATYVNTGGTVELIESLAVGTPSVPEVVYPQRVMARNALAIGAILGIVIAWGVLNRRWLKKVFFSSGENTEST